MTLPIGRSLTDERLHRSAPVAAFATSAHGARTPAGAAAAITVVAVFAGVADFGAVAVFAVAAALAAGAAAVRPAASNPVTAAPLSSPAGTRIGSPNALR